jgi:exonuclease SbcD
VKILHTADWHLGDRLKHIDRTSDLQRGVEQIARYCDQHSVDVLLIAGDLLSELARPESLQVSLAHLSQTLRPFLLRGGTVLAVTGNHDKDVYCETVRRALQLAAPSTARAGDLLPGGRFYLITTPVHFRLADPHGNIVQFVGMPYPTAARYARDLPADSHADFDERRDLLRAAFVRRLRQIRSHLDPNQPSILTAHVNVLPTRPNLLFSQALDQDLAIDDPLLTRGWSYVALGHLHGPGSVLDLPHVRYSGSIERLSIVEKDQQKSVVLIDCGGADRVTDIQLLPLQATTFYDVVIQEPRKELPALVERYPEAATALVRCHIRFQPREDNLYEILASVARIFPRCYERTWSERSASSSSAGAAAHPASAPPTHDADSVSSEPNSRAADALVPCTATSLRELVLGYLSHQLVADADRADLLKLAEQLMEETD